MAFDPLRDEPRLRGLLFAVALVVCALLVVAAVVELRPPWRSIQAEAVAAGLANEVAGGVIETKTCAGEVDRCQTCHAGVERRDLDHAALPLPLRSHSLSLADHPPHRFGCAVCHGGTPRALGPAAHEVPGTGELDPLRVAPWTEAACAQCHLPGAVAGTERLVRGADFYLRLGCAMCHPLGAGGRGGWDFGPDLRQSGRRSVGYLKDSLFEPTKNFPGSTMPSYQHSFTEDRAAVDDLILFLVSLALPRLDACGPGDRAGRFVEAPCSTCHAGPAGRAGGRLTHACDYLMARRELSCGGCHPGEIPAPAKFDGYCPVIREQRSACAVCHQEAATW